MSSLAKRAARKERNRNSLDMNLVALIDIFTILLFFLLSSATELETLVIPRAVALPESTVDQTPKPTVVVLVNAQEIVVDGKTIARTPEVLATEADLIEPLQTELAVLKAAKPEAGGTVTIMGDKDIPYRLLRKVMSTCAQAEFTDVAFAVRTRLEKKT
ncbi:MAG: biopolymer transporter ExbD [Burkholderiaceae bacterium]|nr:biopolymer transporter ExbD [Rhodoferax sp.]MCP5287282.1 biopolymer transporter ExbD [Burkholderiaceae bacterium]